MYRVKIKVPKSGLITCAAAPVGACTRKAVRNSPDKKQPALTAFSTRLQLRDKPLDNSTDNLLECKTKQASPGSNDQPG